MIDSLNIKLIGIDPNRYPNLSKKNYIDVIYQLSEPPPKNWCVIFNDIFKNDGHVRIDSDSRNFIDTWVRDMDEIPTMFNTIKESIETTNNLHHEKLLNDEEARKDTYDKTKSAESIRLEEILDSLDFS